MSSYRRDPHAHDLPPPLIDRIPNAHTKPDLYGHEEGRLTHLKWQAEAAHATERVACRARRGAVVGFAIALLFLASWKVYFGPRYTAQMQELKDMDETPAMSYGSSVRPQFNKMIQVSDMDQQHLPKEGKRLVFVGDVHGCREELEHLLHKVQFDHKHDHLVLTGDAIAKGPDSPGVVSLMQKLGASCVRGNWEDKLLLSIAESASPHLPSLPGPNESADTPTDHLDEASPAPANHKLRKLAKKFSHKQIDFLQQCPVILRVGSVPNLGSLVVVHAGLVPDIPLENQDPYHVMNMRTIDLKTRIPSSKHDGTPWEKFWNYEQTKKNHHERTSVVYGHNRKKGLNLREYTYGLDSGCVSGGHLTAMVVDGHGKTEIVQVKCKRAKGYDTD